jgi:hypothetical protein
MLDPASIAKLLTEPMAVRSGGRSRKMSPFEASLRGMVKSALVEQDVSAVIRFLRLCRRYGLLDAPPPPPIRSGLFFIPRSWDRDEWKRMFNRHGPPPWPGPRSGLPGDPPKA